MLKIIFTIFLLSTVSAFGASEHRAYSYFADGSKFSIAGNDSWVPLEELPNNAAGLANKVFAEKGAQRSIGGLYKKGQETKITLSITTQDFPPKYGCQRLEKSYTKIVAPQGTVFSCNKAETQSPSGNVIMFHYPISDNKFAIVIIDKDVWNNNQSELMAILQSANYELKS